MKLDERFSGVLSDERFQVNPGEVDKYGRKIDKSKKKQAALKELENFYEIDRGSDEEDASGNRVDDDRFLQAPSSSSTSSKLSKKKKENLRVESGKDDPNKLVNRLDYLSKLSRGEISDVETSDSDSEAKVAESDNSNIDVDSAIDDDEVSVATAEELEEGEETNRLAIQNCDWDNMKAEDIL